MADLDLLSLLSDYPIDKIVGQYSGSFSVGAGSRDPFFYLDIIPGEATEIIAHGLGYTPLFDISFSLDGVSFVPGSTEIITKEEIITSPVAGLDVFFDSIKTDSNSSRVRIRAYNYNADSGVTIYYRLTLIHPDETI